MESILLLYICFLHWHKNEKNYAAETPFDLSVISVHSHISLFAHLALPTGCQLFIYLFIKTQIKSWAVIGCLFLSFGQAVPVESIFTKLPTALYFQDPDL